MQIQYLPTRFCQYVAVERGKALSHKTWKAYGYALLPFLRFMERRNLDWRAPQEKDLAYYRRSLQKRALVRARIARIMGIVCDFYEWAYGKGFITSIPVTFEEIMVRDFNRLRRDGAKKLSARPSLIPKVPTSRRNPRFYTIEERSSIINKFDERDALIMQWAVYTGAREFEIAALETDQIPDPSVYRGRRAYPIPLRVTKFDVPGDLYVPTWLLDRTFQYIKFFGRRDIVAWAKNRGKKVPPNVFLGRWATALKEDSIYNHFSDTLKTLGIRGTFHDLRHTFAISTLDALMRLPHYEGTDGTAAIVELRIRMRHGSIAATMKYLRARDFYRTELLGDWELP